jgi:hypothetical protein
MSLAAQGAGYNERFSAFNWSGRAPSDIPWPAITIIAVNRSEVNREIGMRHFLDKEAHKNSKILYQNC